MTITVTDLSKSFPVFAGPLLMKVGVVHAVKNVSFSIPSGESLGIVGESGSGKTTLAKIVAGFITADQGKVEFDGLDLLALNRKKRAPLVQMVFQDPFASLNPKLLLGLQLREALNVRDIRNDDVAPDLLADVGLSLDVLVRYPHQLSGGQRQRFAIARALAAQPALLLADEPVSSLDLSVQAQIINLLNALRQKRRFTMVVISHDLAVIANTCDRILVMKEGETVEQGAVDIVLSKPEQAYTRRLLDAVPI